VHELSAKSHFAQNGCFAKYFVKKIKPLSYNADAKIFIKAPGINQMDTNAEFFLLVFKLRYARIC